MVADRHDDAVHINRELDLLNNKWTTFHTSVKNYRQLLDSSIEYYELYDEVRIQIYCWFATWLFIGWYYDTFWLIGLIVIS